MHGRTRANRHILWVRTWPGVRPWKRMLLQRPKAGKSCRFLLSDGAVQKRSIFFADEQGQVGQRIVADFLAAESTSRETSLLVFCDPEPDGLTVKIRGGVDPQSIREVVQRGDLVRRFQLLGAPAIAAELLVGSERASDGQCSRRHAFVAAISVYGQRVATL